jgi:prepilin-type N-terminal cleavage/methylation domain-containing protein
MSLRKTPSSEQHPRVPSTTRRGFTLIELLVALLLLDVGLLGLVGVAVALFRNGNDTRARARAWATASARVERMASVACGGATAGTAIWGGGVSEWFTEASMPNDTRLLGDSVRVATSRGVQVASLRTVAAC